MTTFEFLMVKFFGDIIVIKTSWFSIFRDIGFDHKTSVESLFSKGEQGQSGRSWVKVDGPNGGSLRPLDRPFSPRLQKTLMRTKKRGIVYCAILRIHSFRRWFKPLGVSGYPLFAQEDSKANPFQRRLRFLMICRYFV